MSGLQNTGEMNLRAQSALGRTQLLDLKLNYSEPVDKLPQMIVMKTRKTVVQTHPSLVKIRTTSNTKITSS